ncbi:MAG: 3-phosphoshikimate 1-carboxyvinyltransferase [Oscillospiraceae bacterium]|nr:3-phosphoshikimate 1-carboxyvinyltransferase [Oscillospiraceae bacterium]
MDLIISPSQAIGTVTAPPSKSMAHRQLIAAALAREPRAVENLDWSEDILATLDCLRVLGASVERGETGVVIGALDPFSQGDPITLPCRESGSTLRFLLPLALLSGREVTFTGSPRLLERPLEPYEHICARQRLYYNRQADRLTVRGPLRPDEFELRGDLSSQFVTGLFFALPFLEAPSRVSILSPVESKSYIDMTLAVLRNYGIRIVGVGNDRYHIPAKQKYHPHPVKVEGDWSGAAILQALNFLGGNIRIRGLDELSSQGDKVFASCLRAMQGKKPTLNVSDTPDLAPILMAVAAAGRGAVLEGTGRLQYKESDRGTAMALELKKFGIQTVVDEHRIWVEDGTLQTPSVPLDSHGDHRIAMALTVLLTLVGGELKGAEAVTKSWPGFFDVLRSLGIVISNAEEKCIEDGSGI